MLPISAYFDHHLLRWPKNVVWTISLSTLAGDAAASALRQYYDQLNLLPLYEKAPDLFSHGFITHNTLERVGIASYIRGDKNRFILLDVIQKVQQKPGMLDDFCSILQDEAAEMVELIKGMLVQDTVYRFIWL